MTEQATADEKALLMSALASARESTVAESARPIVGTLSEKLLHRTLKYYFEPDPERHEIPVEGYVADILNGEGIVEIQTRGFRNLRAKLDAYLPLYPVTVVYPVVVERRVIWVDAESGEAEAPQRSPKKGRASDLLSELSQLPNGIPNGRLRYRLVFLSADEYRLADGRGPNRRRGATKVDIFPTELMGTMDITSLCELGEILPPLPEQFSARQFYSAMRLRGIRASITLSYAVKIGLVERIGQQGRAYLYSKTKL